MVGMVPVNRGGGICKSKVLVVSPVRGMDMVVFAVQHAMEECF